MLLRRPSLREPSKARNGDTRNRDLRGTCAALCLGLCRELVRLGCFFLLAPVLKKCLPDLHRRLLRHISKGIVSLEPRITCNNWHIFVSERFRAVKQRKGYSLM